MATIYTVGHSTRSADEFRELLRMYSIERLVDVRQFPGSRRFPHFGSQAMAAGLFEAGIEYAHEVDLGGRRRAGPDSPNTFWRNASFRSFADHMAGPEFRLALARVIDSAAQQKTALMCAEAVPWRCHRWLISDALAARDVNVVHIIDERHSQPHVLNPHARIDSQGQLTYPADGIDQAGLLF
jgi:uncharacterized protein (DUF488 family)